MKFESLFEVEPYGSTAGCYDYVAFTEVDKVRYKTSIRVNKSYATDVLTLTCAPIDTLRGNGATELHRA